MKTKRYNLVLPQELYDELNVAANRERVQVIDILRKYIKIGMLIEKINRTPNAKVLIRENNVDKEIVIL